MSEVLTFNRRLYQIPERMVKDVETFLEWMEKHALKDNDVRQLYLDFGLYMSDSETEEDRKNLAGVATPERARMIKEGILKTLKTPHGDIDYMDHPLLKGEE